MVKARVYLITPLPGMSNGKEYNVNMQDMGIQVSRKADNTGADKIDQVDYFVPWTNVAGLAFINDDVATN
jgi:hypothetical protein